MRLINIFFFFLLSLGLTAKNTGHKLIIQFENYAGNELLKLDSGTYQNALGQFFTVSRLRYYISNIKLMKQDGENFVDNGYYLIDEEEPGSGQIILNIPEGNYSGISFLLGVDSLHNCSGLQSGALDPVKGMFWAWNTGYVFFKLEGHSAASQMQQHLIEYHIGGFSAPNNNIREIQLDFPAGSPKDFTLITVKTDILQALTTPVDVDFSKIPSVTDFHNAGIISNNYKDMFSIVEIR